MSATPDSTLANPEQRIADLERQLAECQAERDECKAERDEALEQQTATAEVLQVINSSPGDLAPVFDTILKKAHTLCGVTSGAFLVRDDEGFRSVAAHGEAAYTGSRMVGSFRPPEGTPLWRVLRGERLIHLADATADDSYRNAPVYAQRIDAGAIRTLLQVPLRKDGEVLGVITAIRQEVRPFTDKQIALLENFAAQAVIAMENARLITETREALEQQTATAEVLQVINSSPGDLAPIFDAMLEKATRLCEAPFGTLRTWDGERFYLGAVHGEPRFCDWIRQHDPIRPDGEDPLGRIVKGERVVHFADAPEDMGYMSSPGFRAMVKASGMRSAIAVAPQRRRSARHNHDLPPGSLTVH